MTNCPQRSQMAPTVLSRRYCPSCSHVDVEKRLGSSSLHSDSDLTTANHTTFGTVALQDNAKIIRKQAWRWSRPHVFTWPLHEPTYSVLRVALSKREGIAVPRFFGLMADRRRSRARLGSRALGFRATDRRASDTILEIIWSKLSQIW
jgi:hypothetical protein